MEVAGASYPFGNHVYLLILPEEPMSKLAQSKSVRQQILTAAQWQWPTGTNLNICLSNNE
jgi:hypothetical protein